MIVDGLPNPALQRRTHRFHSIGCSLLECQGTEVSPHVPLTRRKTRQVVNAAERSK
jgi:hypothetical protein